MPWLGSWLICPSFSCLALEAEVERIIRGLMYVYMDERIAICRSHSWCDQQ